MSDSAPAEVTFPLGSFKEAAEHLRRPFHPNALKFKVQTSGNPAVVVPYIDARLVIERLNLVIPHLWEASYSLYAGRQDTGHVICELEVDGLSRSDVGRGQGSDTIKAARSDSLKRAAVHFGVGVSLYAMPRFELGVTQKGDEVDGIPTLHKDSRDKPAMNPAALRHLKMQYAQWLNEGTQPGVEKFGPVLDHGDSEISIGDPAEEMPASEGEVGDGDLELSAKRAEIEELYASTTDGDAAKRRKLRPGTLKAQLEGAQTLEELEAVEEKVKAL